jgi:UDP-hydrolysing UDP-N-acetyl-D-glucosamine 2-epimerase
LSEPLRLAILTTGRQDYGILRSTILLLRQTPGIESAVWAGGMHLDGRYGNGLAALHEDGVTPVRELRFLRESPDASAEAAAALEQVGKALKADRPDAVVLLGDRAETLAAALAATIERVPLVHLHGGEESEGAIDNACRHALTKLSHLHLVSHRVHAERVVQMGEDPKTVVVVGAPGLDNIYRDDLPSRTELEASLGSALEPPVVLVTMHPATLGGSPKQELAAVCEAMEAVPATYVVTGSNSDQGGSDITEFWGAWAQKRPNVLLVRSLGDRRYWGLLRVASAVLGNSSSGIIEAPALGVPVINVGDRQRGRLRYGSVADVPSHAGRIAAALCTALASGRQQPDSEAYPAGMAAPRIVEALLKWEIPRPPRKQFRSLR